MQVSTTRSSRRPPPPRCRVTRCLRIAGDVFKDAPEAELENIRSDYLAGRVDRKTASRYLTQRVIAHLPDHVARPYALAAMIMPEVAERQVREVVMPVVDGPEAANPPAARARRVYDALSRASWMAKPSHDGECSPITLRCVHLC